MTPRRAGRALAIAAVLGIAACGDDDPDAAPTTTTSLLAMPGGDGPIAAGTYLVPRSDWSVADLELTFPEGWTVQYGHVFHTAQDQPGEIGFYAVVVDAVYTDPCLGEGVTTQVGPTVDDLVAAVRAQPGATSTEPEATTLGGLAATRFDLRVDPALDLSTCRLAQDGVLGLQHWYSAPADKYFVLQSDGTARVYVLDVAGERQVFLVQVADAAAPEDLAELDAILGSIRIDVT